jgi:hypothetical protein
MQITYLFHLFILISVIQLNSRLIYLLLDEPEELLVELLEVDLVELLGADLIKLVLEEELL